MPGVALPGASRSKSGCGETGQGLASYGRSLRSGRRVLAAADVVHVPLHPGEAPPLSRIPERPGSCDPVKARRLSMTAVTADLVAPNSGAGGVLTIASLFLACEAVLSVFAPVSIAVTSSGEISQAACKNRKHGGGSAKLTKTAAIGGDMLAVEGTDTEEVAKLIVAATESAGRNEASKAAHTSYPSLDPAMVLFQSIIQIRMVRCLTVLPSSVRIARG